jgi:4-hydroxy-tetrahydrodipicolinate synthase
MMMTTTIMGVVPPVATPLDENGALDVGSLGRLIEHLISGGVHGLFLLGSTSEVAFMGEDQRARLLDASMRMIGGRRPVLVGAIDPATERVIGHARVAKAAGVDALVVTAPFYTRTNAAETRAHFRAVRQAVDLPIFAYDIPVAVHSKLDLDTLVELASEGTIVGLKDSSGDEGGFRDVILATRDIPGFVVMTGSERTADAAMLMGAHGIVPGLGNVDPAGYVRLYDAAVRGDWAACVAEQDRLCRLFTMVKAAAPRASLGSAGVGAFKAALQAQGVFATRGMPMPLVALTDAEAAAVAGLVREAGLI